MRPRVERSACAGCGCCVEISPEVFELVNETSEPKVETPPPYAEARFLEAMENCPFEAISDDDVLDRERACREESVFRDAGR